jgi:hypothetical protein
MSATAAARSPASSLASSPDGQWVAIRKGDEILLLAGGAGPPAGRVFIGTDDADVLFVGPPAMVVVVVRNVAPRVMLYQPPGLEVVARHDLDAPMRVAAITGPRIALASPDSKKLVIVRVAATALSAQTIDLDAPLDFAVGLDKNQLLLSMQRKLEVWDAATGRPVLRMQLQLPPPPRTVGAAQGHLWVTRPATDDIIIYRLSDGRPFRHIVGAPPVDVVASPASPIVIVGTQKGLVRVHCFAHSVTAIDAPWVPGTPIAQLAVGDDVSLLGLGDDEADPWRVPIAGAGAPAIPAPPPEETGPFDDTTEETGEPVVKFRSLREKHEADRAAAAASTTPIASSAAPAAAASTASTAIGKGSGSTPALRDSSPVIAAAPPARPTPVPPRLAPAAPTRNWREAIAALGADLVNGKTPDLNARLDDSELAKLADRLLLGQRSIRALVALYGVYLVGEPELAIADLAQVLGDWSEPLGTGELGELAMLRKKRGRVALRGAVSDFFDGVAPRAVRLVGHATNKTKPGAWRLAREGKSDAELEALLTGKLGRIAIVEGDPDRAILEARLHGATAIAFHPPDHKPRPWPRDAGLVLVLYGSPTSWIADIPSIE